MKNAINNQCNCYIDIDRMINEGLGGGFILYEYDKEKLQEPEPEIAH